VCLSVVVIVRARRCSCRSCEYCSARDRYERNAQLFVERRLLRRYVESRRKEEVSYLVEGFLRGEVSFEEFADELGVDV